MKQVIFLLEELTQGTCSHELGNTGNIRKIFPGPWRNWFVCWIVILKKKFKKNSIRFEKIEKEDIENHNEKKTLIQINNLTLFGSYMTITFSQPINRKQNPGFVSHKNLSCGYWWLGISPGFPLQKWCLKVT